MYSARQMGWRLREGKGRRPPRHTQQLWLTVLNDIGEDSFKFVCLTAHQAVGSILSRQVLDGWLAHVLSLGMPASK